MKNMNSNSSVNEDRNAIRQALAILELEGVIIGENDLEIPSDIDIDEVMRIRCNQQARKRNVSWSWSPTQSKSLSDKSTTKSSSMTKNTHSVLEPIPIHYGSDNNNSTKQQEQKDNYISEGDADDSSGSYDGSSSYSSLTSDKNRDVGTKSKRKSKTRRIKPHKAKKEQQKHQDNNNASSSNSNGSRSIQFSNHDNIMYIPHILDFSKEEIEQCWMNEDDYYSIRSRSFRLIEMMEDTKRHPVSACDTMIVNKHLVCVRGLGEKTSQCSYERDQIQRKLKTAVFRLQRQQKKDGIIDEQAIRKICKKYSKNSTKTARFIGISDEVNI